MIKVITLSAPSEPASPSSGAELAVENAVSLPSGSLWAGMHRLSAASEPRPVFIPRDMFPLPPGDGSSSVSPHAVISGRWIVVLPQGKSASPGRLFYGLFSGAAIEWLGFCPGPPAVSLRAEPKALPPYCMADGDLPRLTVSVPADADANAAVAAARGEFLAAAEAAGLCFGSVEAAACWRLADGTLWQLSAPVSVGGTAPPSLRTVSAEYRDGTTFLTLEFTSAPFAVVAEGSGEVPDSLGAWRQFVAGMEIVVCGAGEEFPAVCGAVSECSDLYAVGGRFFAVLPLPDADGTPSGRQKVTVSAAGAPFASESSFGVEHEIFYITASVAVSSAGAAGLPPLRLFCADGIHEFTAPASGGYRYGRLLSRHVPAGRHAFAPLPSGTAFIAASGEVLKLSGSSFSSAGLRVEPGSEQEAKLLYLYGSDSLIVSPPGVAGRHYAWPELWIETGGRVGRAVLRSEGYGPSEAEGDYGGLVPVRSGDLDLSDAFSVKKLEEVHAVWPDGGCRPLKVYGAMRPGCWRFLGLARHGRMRLRGSGWRLFRIETFAVRSSAGLLLPTVSLRYSPAS